MTPLLRKTVSLVLIFSLLVSCSPLPAMAGPGQALSLGRSRRNVSCHVVPVGNVAEPANPTVASTIRDVEKLLAAANLEREFLLVVHHDANNPKLNAQPSATLIQLDPGMTLRDLGLVSKDLSGASAVNRSSPSSSRQASSGPTARLSKKARRDLKRKLADALTAALPNLTPGDLEIAVDVLSPIFENRLLSARRPGAEGPVIHLNPGNSSTLSNNAGDPDTTFYVKRVRAGNGGSPSSKPGYLRTAGPESAVSNDGFLNISARLMRLRMANLERAALNSGFADIEVIGLAPAPAEAAAGPGLAPAVALPVPATVESPRTGAERTFAERLREARWWRMVFTENTVTAVVLGAFLCMAPYLEIDFGKMPHNIVGIFCWSLNFLGSAVLVISNIPQILKSYWAESTIGVDERTLIHSIFQNFLFLEVGFAWMHQTGGMLLVAVALLCGITRPIQWFQIIHYKDLTAIKQYFRGKHNLLINTSTAREIREWIRSAAPLSQGARMEVAGLDQAAGRTKTIWITPADAQELRQALTNKETRLAEKIWQIIKKWSPFIVLQAVVGALLIAEIHLAKIHTLKAEALSLKIHDFLKYLLIWVGSIWAMVFPSWQFKTSWEVGPQPATFSNKSQILGAIAHLFSSWGDFANDVRGSSKIIQSLLAYTPRLMNTAREALGKKCEIAAAFLSAYYVYFYFKMTTGAIGSDPGVVWHNVANLWKISPSYVLSLSIGLFSVGMHSYLSFVNAMLDTRAIRKPEEKNKTKSFLAFWKTTRQRFWQYFLFRRRYWGKTDQIVPAK